MRIMLLTSKLNFVNAGGSVADLHLKARGLAERGHEVTVVTAFSDFNKLKESLPYRLREENTTSARLLTIQCSAYRLLRKYEELADIFYIDGHIFLYGAGLYRLLGGRKPIVAFFNIRLNAWGDTHGADKQRRMLWRTVKKKLRWHVEKILGVPLANRLDVFVFNTPQVERLFLEWGFDHRKSLVIEDFVDTVEIHAQARSSSELEEHQRKSTPIIFFTGGRMIPEKGFDLVIKAFVRMKNKDRYQVIISGGGPEYENLAKLTRELGLENYITLPGWVNKEELQKFFQQADIFIFPKWWIEYGSAVLTEAMAYGLPCIVPAGGALEWLAQGAAIAFQSDDEAGLARQMERLASDVGLRLELAHQSIARAEALDCQRLAARLEAVMLSVR